MLPAPSSARQRSACCRTSQSGADTFARTAVMICPERETFIREMERGREGETFTRERESKIERDRERDLPRGRERETGRGRERGKREAVILHSTSRTWPHYLRRVRDRDSSLCSNNPAFATKHSRNTPHTHRSTALFLNSARNTINDGKS